MRKSSIAKRNDVWTYIRDHPWSTARQVSEGTGHSTYVVRKHLAALVEGEYAQWRKMPLGRNVSARAYATVEEETGPRITVSFDSEVWIKPVAIQVHLTLEGDLPAKATDYSLEYRDMPITGWQVTMVTSERVEILHDDKEHKIQFFDPGLRAWFSGPVILQFVDLQSAKLAADSESVTLVYLLKGMGDPSAPEIQWYP